MSSKPHDPAAHKPQTPAAPTPFLVVLTGNPNCGKTTLFNALTGLRAKVGNYAGVTVERKEGRMRSTPPDLTITILDLPGTYSLSPQSIDEQIARDVLLNHLPELPPPDLVVAVVDASNLERNLYYASQVIELGYPVVVALNMIDVAAENGHALDVPTLAEALGVPVVPMVASTGENLADLRARLITSARLRPPPAPVPAWPTFPQPLQREIDLLAGQLRTRPPNQAASAAARALLLLTDDKALPAETPGSGSALPGILHAARQRLESEGLDWRSVAIEARYVRASAVHAASVAEQLVDAETFSDRLDRIVTHRIWGTVLFVTIMGVMFQSIFTFAQAPMDLIESAVSAVGATIGRLLPPGDLNSLLVDGAVAGVGAILVFLPQILLLFLFIGLLEDTGYMARAAFLMDRLMSKVGLHGKSFIPLLSSFACAIPGIMATRTIESPKDRLVTMLVAPLMSCSARLPVYTVLIAACIPQRHVLGVFHLQGVTLLGMYLLGVVMALLMAWLFKRTLLRGEPPLLVMELPPYRRPVFRVVLRHMWDRSGLFIRRAGTVILGASILLWFLASYPRSRETSQRFDQLRAEVQRTAEKYPNGPAAVRDSLDHQIAELDRSEAGERLRESFAGRLGRALEPAIAPLGFDWKIGIGIVASFAAREVFVSTMSTVYNVDETSSPKSGDGAIVATLQAQRRLDGSVLYTPATSLSLMVFYVFALQCVSTVAVMRRETNSWKWPLFQWLYMGALAWIFAFVTYHGAHYLLGA